MPRVWRFQPYAEGTGGVAHMQSQVYAVSLFTDARVVPVLNLGAGAEFRIGEHFAIDAGYTARVRSSAAPASSGEDRVWRSACGSRGSPSSELPLALTRRAGTSSGSSRRGLQPLPSAR
jgi:hypothetical protein